MSSFGIPYPKSHLLRLAVELIGGLALLWALALAGNAAASALHLPIPGMLLGAVALLIWLAYRPSHADRLVAADSLVALMPLFFVPLVVEAIAPLRALGAALVPFLITVVASTLGAFVATVAVARGAAWLSSRSR